MDVIVDQHAVFKFFCQHDSYEFRSNLTANRNPGVIDAIILANVLGIVKRGWRVAISQDENLLWLKDL